MSDLDEVIGADLVAMELGHEHRSEHPVLVGSAVMIELVPVQDTLRIKHQFFSAATRTRRHVGSVLFMPPLDLLGTIRGTVLGPQRTSLLDSLSG
jgi:hypothetical protein